MLHLVFHSVNQCLVKPCWSPKCSYGSLAPSPHAADQSDDHDLWDYIPLLKDDFVVCPADWMLRIAFPSWFHNCSIGFRSGLHAGHSIPGICLACRWSRTILAVWGRTLNQIKLWNLGNEIMFRLSAFMSFILCMKIICYLNWKWNSHSANIYKIYDSKFTND